MGNLKEIKTGLKIGNAVRKSPFLLGAMLGAGVFVADQLFKSSVEMQPEGTFPHDLSEKGIGSLVEFQKVHNRGISMGRLQNSPEAANKLAASGAAAAVTSLIARDRKNKAGIIGDFLVLGGAASNLYDRAVRGYVVDYIHVKTGKLSEIVFNLGDAAIAAGAFAGSLSRMLHSRKKAFPEEGT